MSNMFRASPWVTYEPTSVPSHLSPPPSTISSTMDHEDVDMDAPQISTLKDEDSPPPQRKQPSSRKGKAAAKAKAETWTQPPRERKPAPDAASEEDFEEPEEEEDQLIDDDDDDTIPKSAPVPLASTSARVADTTQKPKPVTGKRKSRKSEKGAEKEKEEEKDKDKDKDKDKEKVKKEEKEEKEKERKIKKPRKSKVSQQITGAPDLAPTMLCFEATPAESHEDSGHTDANVTHVGEPEPISKPGRKKATSSPRKAPPGSKPKGKSGPKPKNVLPPQLLAPEDLASVGSEAPTAPSSPATTTMQVEMSPEPEPRPSADAPEPPQSPEKPDLENVPLPQYPLPTKPFPVQLPPKINSGFAPAMPLDKGGKKVRHWRTANREIRGIAGGRWFARAWVGDKESEYATAVAAAQALKAGMDDKNGLMSKMPLTSISAPPGMGGGRGKKSKANSASVTASAAPSRSGSTGPDLGPGIPIMSKPHVPTKMRVQHLAPEDTLATPTPTAEQDVDMAPPPSET